MILNDFTKAVVLLILSVLLIVVAENLLINKAFADSLDDSISILQHGWAKAYYQIPDNQKDAAFDALSGKAHQLTTSMPNRAEPLIWEAIILSSAAKFSGGLTALSQVKNAKELLERAEKIDPLALNGSIYTSLGSLYYKVPIWPVAFGNKQKARAYLDKAIKINPDGIDTNFFYADFLFEQSEYAKSKEYLEKALVAPPRVGREDADQGRHAEVEALLIKVKQRLMM